MFLIFLILFVATQFSLNNGEPESLDKAPFNGERSFKIDKERNTFLKDGQPFRYIAGEINYFRIHQGDWEDRLKKVRAAGLNAVSVYLPWMLHQPTPDSFDFSGQNNFTEFLRIAQKYQLFTLLRIGPYVCAELEFGGLPWWLNKQEKMQLRTSDEKYLFAVKRYFDVLLPMVKPLLYQNGGPVIMVQVENEYGYRKQLVNESCDGLDKKYLEYLRDEVRGHLGQEVVLYATDPEFQRMKCSHIDGVYSTPDFGVLPNEQSVLERVEWQRKLNGGGPLVNSEFYTTWFTWWSNPKEVAPNMEGVRQTMDWMWKANGSFSFYMIHGGSNFNFLAGNKHDWIFGTKEGPVAQSYDYAAPIDEAGQITPLYLMIREWIKEKADWPNKPWDLPEKQSGAQIENVHGRRINLIDLIGEVIGSESSTFCLNKQLPMNIEQLDHEYPLSLFSTILDEPGNGLEIPGLADHGYIYLDGQFKGNLTNVFSGTFTKKLKMDGLNATKGQRLDIIVEHLGRLLFPLAELDHKGILSQVLLDGHPIQANWRLCGIDVHKLNKAAQAKLEEMKKDENNLPKSNEKAALGPAIYAAEFSIEEEEANFTELYTFFDTRGWGHGILIVNDFVVGRYWPVIGPQMSLFVPGPLLKQKGNFVALFELSGPEKEDRQMPFVPGAIWEYPSQKKMSQPPSPRKRKTD